MLYEDCDSPDAELMQATARRPGTFNYTSDDEEAASAGACGGAPAVAAPAVRSKHGLDRLRSTKQVVHAAQPPPPPPL